MGKVAKVKTEQPESTGAEEAANGGAEGAMKQEAKAPAPKQEIFYRPLRARTAEDKLPKQAQIIVDVLNGIEGAATNGVSRVALVKALEDGGQLQTRQPVERIVSYYQAKLQTMGLIEHGKRNVE